MMDQVAHTDALIPKWCVYDEKQSLTFVSPQSMEAYFVENTGIVDIPYNYVNRLNTLLDRMHDTIMATMTEREYITSVAHGHNFMNEIVNVQLDLNIGSSVYLSLIEVRPCAEGLGIFRLVLWQLLQTCKCGGWKLGVGNPFPKTQKLLQRAAKDLFQGDGEGGMIIQAQDILKCDIRNFDILDKLLICGLEAHKLTLNRKGFPHADVMNIHQDQLDRRLEHKLAMIKPISEKKRRQALAEDRRVRAAQSVVVDRSLLPALEKPCRGWQNLRNYFGDFSNFLLRIRHQFGVYGGMYRTNFRAFYDADKLYVERCKVAQCKISFGVDVAATLHVLDILDVLSADVQNLILWQILQCCYDAGLDFKMGLCTMRVGGLGVFKTKTEDGRFWVISRDDIGKLQIKQFNILDKIYDGYDEDFPISVNPRESKFPTEDDLYTPMPARY